LEKSENPPKKLQVRVRDDGQSEKVAGWSGNMDELGIETEVIVDNRPRADWLARLPSPGTELNLLTGPYKRTGSRKTSIARYVPATLMGTLLIILMLAQVIVDKNRAQAEYELLRAEAEATYRELFPQARNLVDPRYQMERALDRLQSNSNEAESPDDDLLSQLEAVSRHINPATANIQRIEYDGNKLTLDVNIKNYELLEELQQRLGAEMKVSVESAELQGEQVLSRIRLENRT
ncbi:MAG: hypothetical protein HKN08_12015, partial [Gammaproteobacteria bacterium]|nr:hypothetical protein [Gammaproteobacteria bacterium]